MCSQSSYIAVSSHQISEWFVHNHKEGKGGKKEKNSAEMSTKLHIEDIPHIYKICITKGRTNGGMYVLKTFPDSVSFLHERVNMGQCCSLQTLNI